jgi:hypothetical protein
MTGAVDACLDGLSADDRAGVDRLRAVVRAAAPGLIETIKWNAPSFADGDQDRVTLGIERKGGWRMVLHRGAAVKDAAGFAFDDAAKVARWPSPDRGVATFADIAAIDMKAAAIEDLVRRWIEANRSQA